MIQLGEGGSLTDLQGVMSNRYSNMSIKRIGDEGTVEYAFAMKQEIVDDIEKAIQQAQKL